MIEYFNWTDVVGFNDDHDITKNGELDKLGQEGWDCYHLHIQNGRRTWYFKRTKTEEPKKRGRPKKVKDAA